MSQKGEEFDPPNKNLFPHIQANTQPPPSQFMPPNSQYPMPPNPYQMGPNPWDWYNPYNFGPQAFDPAFREEMSKSFQFQQGNRFNNNYNNKSMNKINESYDSFNDDSDRFSVFSSVSHTYQNNFPTLHSWTPYNNERIHQVFNNNPFPSAQATPLATPHATPQKQSNNDSTAHKSTASMASVQPQGNNNKASSQQQYPPPPGSVNGGFMPPPYMDPAAAYMYYQMAAQQPFGFHPMHNPFPNPYGMGPMPPYGMYGSASLSGGQRQLQEDQQSMKSFHFEALDTRSEKPRNPSFSMNQIKAEAVDNSQHGGLLMEDPNQSQNINTEILGLTENPSEADSKREEIQHRMTPQLHNIPHVRAAFSLNNIVQIRANDPCVGQPALVDILNLTDIMEQYLTNLKNMQTNELNELEDETYISSDMRNEILMNYKLVQEFPGPLVKEHTSKAQLIQFCQKNVKDCLSSQNVNLIDPQSHALLWDYLALLVRQNGLVDLKTDISPLLLSGIAESQGFIVNQQTNNNRTIIKNGSSVSLAQQDFVLVNEDSSNHTNGDSASSMLSRQSSHSDTKSQRVQNLPITEEESHMNKLRQLLGAGQKADAIEVAIKYNMWPHALFLSSSSCTTTPSSSSFSTVTTTQSATQVNDSKALNKVKVKFINSLHVNDPIHTCYQLLIGRIPTVANNVSKSEWNDWRRHLAMIVSNVDESNRDLVLNTIKTMGDSLASNGRVAASHFCYLLAKCSFGSFDKKSSKLVLIGSSHNQDFNKFCQINSIQATEIFEFANSFSSSKSEILNHFVKYKLIYTTRLLEFGLINEAYKYIEVIAKAINENPQLHASKVSSVFQLANRLRVHDPDFNAEDLSDPSNEPQWLQDLTNNYKKIHLNKFWHLLPSSENVKSIEPSENLNVETKNNNLNEQNLLLTDIKQQQITPVPQENFQFITSSNDAVSNDLNLGIYNLTLNNEKNTQIDYSQPQQPQQQPEESYNAESQQPITFYSNNNQNGFANQEPNYAANNNENASQEIRSNNYQISINQTNSQNTSEDIPQFYDNQPQISQNNIPQQDYLNQQPQQQSQQQPQHQEYSYHASRESSVSSNIIPPQPNANDSSEQPQQPQQPQLYNQGPPTQGFMAQSNNLRKNSIASLDNSRQHDSNRSRLSSTSTNGGQFEQPQFTPFNPYQSTSKQQQQQKLPSMVSQPLFDPTAQMGTSTGLQRSSTYPSAEKQQENIEEENNTSNQTNTTQNGNNNEDEDEDLMANPKPKAAKKDDDKLKPENAQGDWWLGRVFNKFRPAQGPKSMVLPDDRKKKIYWDEKLKRYVNKEHTENPATAIKPPPTFMAPQQNEVDSLTNAPTFNPPTNNDEPSQNSQQVPQNGPQMPPPSSGPNRFSLKNSGGKKTSYYSNIDQMVDKTKKLPSQKIDQSLLSNPLLSTMAPPSQLPPRFFVPEPSSNSQQPEPKKQEEPQEDNTPNFNDLNAQYQQEINSQQQQPAMYQPQQEQAQPQMYQNQQQQHFQPQMYQNQPQQQQLFQPQYQMNNNSEETNHYAPEEHSEYNYEDYSQNNDDTEESDNSGTNPPESYNGSSQTSSSNESAYIQNQYMHTNYGQYYPSQEQYYNPHSNI